LKTKKSNNLGFFVLGSLAFLVVSTALLVPGTLSAPLGFRYEESRVLFLGDLMFDRTMRTIGEREGYDYLFSCVTEWLWSYDLVVGNLEGPVTTYRSSSVGTVPGDLGNMRFTFAPAVVDTLRDHNIQLLHVGNNHIFDFGKEGVSSTRGILGMRGLSVFGDPLETETRSAVRTLPGARVAFISYNEFSPYQNASDTEREIKEARGNADVVLVYTHWGDEYVAPPERVRTLARRFVDVGADAVIGSHPHVVQEREVYQGKTIYYSLGNFIFDQYWNEEVRTGLALEVVLKEGKIEKFIEHPVTILRDGRTCRK
jgi:poly-gamma-glutamate synthesis protein (capsule biosynthesis protein)